jgi:hypothetical protein
MEEISSWTHSAAFFWVACTLILKRSDVARPLEGGDNIMTETSETVEKSAADYPRLIDVRKSGYGYLFTLPHTLHNGTPVELYVEFDGHAARINDQGLLSHHLDMAGVDLEKNRIATAWNQIQTSVGYAPDFSAKPWELSALAERNRLSSALYAVANSAVRADGLRVLASQYRPRSFSERVVSTLGRRLTVVPRAVIPGKYGSQRVVTCSVGVKTVNYIQAIGGSDRMGSFDRTISLFNSSTIPADNRIALLQGPAGKWEDWQVRALKDVSTTYFEDDLSAMVNELARAEAA